MDGLLSIFADHLGLIGFYAAVAVAAVFTAWFQVLSRHREAHSGGKKHLVGWAMVLVVPTGLYLAALAGKFSVEASLFTAILGTTVLMWMFSLADEFVPVLFAVVATLFIGLAPPNVALGGFSSPSLLLLIGVFALSAVMSLSALSSRVMLWALMRLPDRPFWHQFTLLAGGYLISPVMPSANARISLLLPIFKDMAGGLRLPARGLSITGLMAATFAGGVLFSPMMATSRSANIAAINFLPKQMQAEFLGLFWLTAAAVAALVVTGFHLMLIARMFPAREKSSFSREELLEQLAAMGPLKSSEMVAAAGFLFFLFGCATVSWHHVSPALLGGCILLLLLVSGTLGRKEFRRELDWPMVLFLLGIDCITKIMSHLGIDRSLAEASSGLFDFVGGSIWMFIPAVLAVSVLLRLFLPIAPSMLTAIIILLPVASAQGIHPWICLFLAGLFSDMWFARYQGTGGYLQICASDQIDRIDAGRFLRYNLTMNAARVVAAFASIPWWNWIGLL